MYSNPDFCTSVMETGFMYTCTVNLFVYNCTVNWFCVLLYCKLVLCAHVQVRGMYRGQTLQVRGMYRGQTLNMWQLFLFIKPVLSTCIHRECTGTDITHIKEMEKLTF